MTNKDNAVCTARRGKARQYRRLYASCFLVFLIITVIERILPQQLRFRQVSSTTRKSIIEETKEQTGSFVPFLFMNF